jgi:hypothetical protein
MQFNGRLLTLLALKFSLLAVICLSAGNVYCISRAPAAADGEGFEYKFSQTELNEFVDIFEQLVDGKFDISLISVDLMQRMSFFSKQDWLLFFKEFDAHLEAREITITQYTRIKSGKVMYGLFTYLLSLVEDSSRQSGHDKFVANDFLKLNRTFSTLIAGVTQMKVQDFKEAITSLGRMSKRPALRLLAAIASHDRLSPMQRRGLIVAINNTNFVGNFAEFADNIDEVGLENLLNELFAMPSSQDQIKINVLNHLLISYEGHFHTAFKEALKTYSQDKGSGAFLKKARQKLSGASVIRLDYVIKALPLNIQDSLNTINQNAIDKVVSGFKAICGNAFSRH